MRTATKLLTVLGEPGYVDRIRALGPVAYWPLRDPSGSVATELMVDTNGAYAGTVTLAQAALGDGGLYPSFGGGRVSLATPLSALNSLFNGQLGSALIWAKVSAAGAWTDGIARFAIEFGADANNRVLIFKNSTNNQVTFRYVAGATQKNVTLATSVTTWLMLACTWNKADDQFIAYANGAQTGSTQTSLGTYTGSLNASWTAIADVSSGGGATPWSGNLAHPALWNRVLTPAEVASLYVGAYAV